MVFCSTIFFTNSIKLMNINLIFDITFGDFRERLCLYFQYLSPRITFCVEVSMEIAGQVLESKVSSLSEEMRRKVLQKIRSELENQILDRDETFVLSNPRKSTTIKKTVGSFGGT